MMHTARDITAYRLTENDRGISNPYLMEVIEFFKGPVFKVGERDIRIAEKRAEFIHTYAFAIPTSDIISLIAGHSPIIEIGAGAGYWAWCLHQSGAVIKAVDSNPPDEGAPWDWQARNPWFDDTWYSVFEGDEYSAAEYPDRALFLCWPPPSNPMASRSLSEYRRAGGHTLIYLGDPGSSGDEEFHREREQLRLLGKRKTWSWPGIDEYLFIYSMELSSEKA